MTTAGTDVISSLIREVASLQEESKRLCKPIQDRMEKARQLLKDAMTEADTIDAIDEVSGYRALITQSHSTEYVPEKLLPLLRTEQAERVVDTTVTIRHDVIKDMVAGGELTWSRLEQAGAMVRRLRARMLKLEPLKGARP